MMCSRDQSSGLWLAVLFCLLALFSARTAWGDESSEPIPNPSAQSTPAPLPATTSSWQNFDQAWSSLKSELTASDEDWARLLTSLQNLQTVANELQLSLQESNQLLQLSEQSLKLERLGLAATITERNTALDMLDRSRALSAILGGIATVSSLILILSIVF